MSTEKDSLPTQRNRRVPTRVLFYRYWVLGEGIEVACREYDSQIIEQRPIPTRSRHDAKRLRRGDVQIQELWDKYLTDFQQDVASELYQERLDERLGKL